MIFVIFFILMSLLDYVGRRWLPTWLYDTLQVLLALVWVAQSRSFFDVMLNGAGAAATLLAVVVRRRRGDSAAPAVSVGSSHPT